MISCVCDFECEERGQWYGEADDFFKPLNTKTRKRCLSCGELINIGSESLKINRCHPPWTDIELNIYGDEVPLAPKYMCEKCGEIYLNLTALGYCVSFGNMHDALEEYHDITGWKPIKEVRK